MAVKINLNCFLTIEMSNDQFNRRKIRFKILNIRNDY